MVRIAMAGALLFSATTLAFVAGIIWGERIVTPHEIRAIHAAREAFESAVTQIQTGSATFDRRSRSYVVSGALIDVGVSRITRHGDIILFTFWTQAVDSNHRIAFVPTEHGDIGPLLAIAPTRVLLLEHIDASWYLFFEA